MISALGRASFVDEAEQLLDDALSIGVTPDVFMYFCV